MLRINTQTDKICRVLFLLVISSLIVIIAVFYIDVHYNMFIEKQTQIVINTATHLDTHLNGRGVALTLLASNREFAEYHSGKAKSELLSAAKLLDCAEISIYDKDGKILTSSDENGGTKNSDQVSFRQALQGKTLISNRIDSENLALNSAYITISTPLFVNQNQVQAVMSAKVYVTEIADLIKQYQDSDYFNQYMAVIDGNAKILYSSEAAGPMPERFSQEGQKLFDKSQGNLILAPAGQDNKYLYIFASVSNTNWRVVMTIPVYSVWKNVALHLLPELTTVVLLLTCLSLLYNGLYQNKRHKLERDMLRLEKLATVNQLAAGIAHEIRNPLTSIKGFIQLILEKGEKPAPREYLEVALSEIERIERLTNEFQVLARPVKPPVFKITDLAGTIRDVLILMKSQAESKNIVLEFQYKTGFIVNGDASQLKQVWINLLRNALEAVDERGTISIQMELRSNVIETKIYNSGTGIPEHLLSKLGTPFFTTKESGTGLGLSVCYSIITGHGGRIKVASGQTIGTTFTVALPYIGEPA